MIQPQGKETIAGRGRKGSDNETGRPSESLSRFEKTFYELKALYGRVKGESRVLASPCRRDGACCRFSSSGLRLFVSSLEVAYQFHRAGSLTSPLPECVCPYLEENLCRAREGRFLGCRIYHCEEDGAQERARLYEKFHKEIRDLHERYDVEYVYTDLMNHPFFLDAEWSGVHPGGRA